ncbi:hypothetical protein LWI29_018500 [Acer saccharum]|uniref:BAH domain-containing protein n=1 Tax=Acer saccharum TaxID=4024 RepID=A0AA39SIU6_ACESA|nr:hypothetical protein LWI29_018500 [Acer saccharum]
MELYLGRELVSIDNQINIIALVCSGNQVNIKEPVHTDNGVNVTAPPVLYIPFSSYTLVLDYVSFAAGLQKCLEEDLPLIKQKQVGECIYSIFWSEDAQTSCCTFGFKDKSIRLSEKVSVVEKLLLKVGHNVVESQTSNWLPISLACHRSPALLFQQQPGQFLIPLLRLHNPEEEVYKKLARYRLGKPSKQYAPWYEPVLKTVRLAEDKDQETFKGGRNVGLKAYVVCQLLEIEVSKEQGSAKSTKIKVQRIFSHEDISVEKAYCSDIQEVYYGEQVLTVPIIGTEGKCDIRKKHDLPSMDSPITFEHIFFCEHLYGSDKAGAIKQVVYVFFIVL